MGRHRALKGQRRLPGAEDITVTNTSVHVKKPAKASDDIGHAKTEADPKLKSTLSASGDPDDAPPGTIPPSAPIVLPPALAERFEVGKLLGHGGMGDVYQAHDKRLGRDIALKILRAGRSTVNETLFREARAQASLEHPNACKVYEMGVEGDIRYIVMQLINGVSLDKVGDELTLEQKVKIVQQISKGLHEVHRMGLVHRDLKPSNIMVEDGERGEHKAYLMDFGLAREIGAQGHTVTGVVAGTPAFMAPEQGRGEIRKLDRRTDVYSLGATMYSLFTGKPPFEASSLYTLLEKISTEDPQPLRKLDPTIPIDIEAVVLKCLEKEPHHRYESAKALDEDLQRFLDGEPVRARDASIVYVLYKKIRKHKLFVSIAAAAFAVVLVFTVIWIRSQRIASAQTALARELGEDIKEIEWLLRTAYGLPLHDIEYERSIVEKRLQKIEERMPELGESGEGPSLYALGKGYIALQEPDKALDYLLRAERAGYKVPELNYALGIAEGELYRRSLIELRKMPESEARSVRQREIDAKYKEPALKHLQLSAGARLDSKELLEGMIDFYSERYENAIEKARIAFQASPWLYEAKKLEGDVYYTQGLKWAPNSPLHSLPELLDAFEKASDAYENARAIARSDPAVHNAECELSTQRVLAFRHTENNDEMARLVAEAEERCEAAMKASSRNEEGIGRAAYVHVLHAWGRMNLQGSSASVHELVQKALEEAKKVHDDRNGNAFSFYVLGSAWRTRAFFLYFLGLDNGYELERAAWSYEDSLERDPAFSWGLNEICSALDMQLQRDMSVGNYSNELAERVFEICNRAVLYDPNSMMANLVMISSKIGYGHYAVDMGVSPAPSVAWISSELAKLRAKATVTGLLDIYGLHAGHVQARGELESGSDPRPTIASCLSRIPSLPPDLHGSPEALEPEALLLLVRGDYAIRNGMNPEPDLLAAIRIFDSLLVTKPTHVDYVVPRVQAGVLLLSSRMKSSPPPISDFEEIESLIAPFISGERFDPRVYRVAAELSALKAEWLGGQGSKKTSAEIDKGMRLAEQALKLYPNMAAGHFVMGRLLAMQALAGGDSEAGQDARKQAKHAFEQAALVNVWFKPRVEAELAKIGEL